MNPAKAVGLVLLGLGLLCGAAEAGFSVNENTGEARYSYPISIPAARGRYQPSVSLEYGSSNKTDYGYGYGWGLSLPERIEVIRPTSGPTDCCVGYKEILVHNGARRALVWSQSRSAYRAEIEDDDAHLNFVIGCAWIRADDAAGNHYEFAGGDGYCGGNYYLTTITDLDGNSIYFEYVPLPQYYPVLVSSSGLPPSGVLSKITYNYYNTNGDTQRVYSGSTTYATSVEFEYAMVNAVGTTPPDVTLKNIRVKNQGNTIRRYEMSTSFVADPYSSQPPVLRVLTAITEHGKESGTTLAPTTFGYAASPALGPITTPTGARYDIAYGTTPDNDWKATSVTLSGPGLETNQIKYFYDSWMPSTTNWYDGSREQIGFARSYALDTSTNTVTMTTWETNSHVFRGVPAQIESGPAINATASPPTYSVFMRTVSEHTSLSFEGAGCISPAASPTPSTAGLAQDWTGPGPLSWFYPVMAFTSRLRTATFVDGVEFAGENTLACNSVDKYGNVLQRHLDPDVARAGDDTYVNTSFVITTTATPCKNCISRRTITADVQQTALLASTRFVYDAGWRVAQIWTTTEASIEARTGTFTYNANGALASRTDGPDDEAIISVYTYESPYQFRPAKIQTIQGSKSLSIDTSYDGYGRPVLVVGPYLGSSPAGAPVHATSYDDLGRVVATALQAISGTTVSNGTAAWTYADYNPAAPSTPAAVMSYSFAVPLTYNIGSPPQTSDARQTVTYLDALGRSIQMRERLGGSASGSASASITQNLSNFRVSAIIYDRGGRLRAEVEPFYAASGAFRDYRSNPLDAVVPANNGGLSTAMHVRLHSYDAQGREICSTYAYASNGGTIPSPPANCASNFSEGSAYARATATCYRAAAEMSPPLLGTKVIGPELTVSGAPNCSASVRPRGSETFSSPSGRIYRTTDVDGNGAQLAYELMGNVTALVRTGADGVSVAASSSYDMAGRLKHRTDPDIGTQDYTYFASGRPKRVTYAAHSLGGGLSGNDYVDMTYDMGRPATRNMCRAAASGSTTAWTCVQDVFGYDSPYQGGSYLNVAGKLSFAQNANTTIAFGYTPDGLTTNRDQWVSGLSGVFAASLATRLDQMSTSLTVSSGYSNAVTGQIAYDSFARPVQLTSGNTVVWSTNAGSLGSYDALGRPASVSQDNGLVTWTRTFASYSALESSAQVHLSSSNQDLYRISGETFVANKLAGFRDEMAGATYSYSYFENGRLKAAKAVPDTPSVPTSVLCLSFNRDKHFGTPYSSLGNLERIRTQRYTSGTALPSSVDTYNYSGTDVAVSGSGPDAPTSVTNIVQTANLLTYDYSGRIISKLGGAEQLTYDAVGRLTSVTRANDVGEVLTYDPMGVVLGRLSGGILKYYVGSVATATTSAPAGCTMPGCGLDPSSTITIDVHLGVGGRRIASIRALSAGTGRVLYYHRDRLGSVVATSTDGGMPGALYRYDPYGDLTMAQGDSGDSASELGFTGQVRLSNGLYVMGVRAYDARLRQFLQPDVINPMSYTYAGGDPINFVDPSGRAPRKVRESSEEPVPGVDTTHPGGGTDWTVIVDPDTWKWIGEQIWDGIKDIGSAIGDFFSSVFGGGDDPPPPPPVPPRVNTGAPPTRTSGWQINRGFGFGATYGGIAEGGMVAGLGVTANTSIGNFWSLNGLHNNGGDWFFTGGWCCEPRSSWIAGWAAGYGWGGFVTNASSPTDMLGKFDNVNINASLFVKTGLTVSWGQNEAGNWIFVLSPSVGAGVPGFSVSRYPTYTTSFSQIFDEAVCGMGFKGVGRCQ